MSVPPIFRNPAEMGHDEILDYIREMEVRVENADRGARLFKDEANLNRAENLKLKEIAAQSEDVNALMFMFFERHIEALRAVSIAGYDSMIENSDAVTVVRILKYMLGAVLDNFRREFGSTFPAPDEPPDWSDIPF